jgi:hypothetical protein
MPFPTTPKTRQILLARSRSSSIPYRELAQPPHLLSSRSTILRTSSSSPTKLTAGSVTTGANLPSSTLLRSSMIFTARLELSLPSSRSARSRLRRSRLSLSRRVSPSTSPRQSLFLAVGHGEDPRCQIARRSPSLRLCQVASAVDLRELVRRRLPRRPQMVLVNEEDLLLLRLRRLRRLRQHPSLEASVRQQTILQVRILGFVSSYSRLFKEMQDFAIPT